MADYLTSLCLCFLIHEMGITVAAKVVGRNRWLIIGTVLGTQEILSVCQPVATDCPFCCCLDGTAPLSPTPLSSFLSLVGCDLSTPTPTPQFHHFSSPLSPGTVRPPSASQLGDKHHLDTYRSFEPSAQPPCLGDKGPGWFLCAFR